MNEGESAQYLTDLMDEARVALLESYTPESEPAPPAVLPFRMRGTPVDPEQKMASARLWLVSFTDLFSLLLCLFLMIFSSRDIDFERMKKLIIDGRTERPVSLATAPAISKGESARIERIEYGEGLDLGYLQGVLKTTVEQAGLSGEVRVVPGRGMLRLVFERGDLFAGGNLSARGVQIAEGLGPRLARLSNSVSVVGAPSDSGAWAQGLARADAFAGALKSAGYSKTLTVLADGRGGGQGVEIRVGADDGQIR